MIAKKEILNEPGKRSHFVPLLLPGLRHGRGGFSIRQNAGDFVSGDLKKPESFAFAYAAPEIGYQSGLTKRELFAAMALHGSCAPYGVYNNADLKSLTRNAVKLADALIRALEEKT